jgi:spoIIIJ-associated protein
MSSYEFTGKSVREAVSKACMELNLEEDRLDVHVIEESTRGFLGIVGQRDARIRVTVKEGTREMTEEILGDLPSLFSPEQDAEVKETGTSVEPEPHSAQTREEVPDESLDPIDEHTIEQAQKILEGILERIPVEAEVVSSVADGAINLEIRGDGSGLLIGKRGQTLDALQFVVSKCLNKGAPSNKKIEVTVDTENYRQRKTENLRDTALKMSQKAKKTLKPVSFNPMPPSERRIIHLILAEDNEVYTKSYGEGPMRRIIVYPRRGGANKRRRR